MKELPEEVVEVGLVKKRLDRLGLLSLWQRLTADIEIYNIRRATDRVNIHFPPQGNENPKLEGAMGKFKRGLLDRFSTRITISCQRYTWNVSKKTFRLLRR